MVTGNAGVGKAHGDAAAHGAGADHRRALDIVAFLRPSAGRRSCAAARSAKKMWRWAFDWSPSCSSTNLSRSRFSALVDRQVDGRAQGFDRRRRRVQAARPFACARRRVRRICRGRPACPQACRPYRGRGAAASCRQQACGQMRCRRRSRRRRQWHRPGRASSAALAPIGSPRQDHRQRLCHADQPRQPLRAAGAGNEPELDFRKAEPRAGRGDAKMAAERDLKPAAERGAMQSRDHGLRHRIERSDDIASARGPAAACRTR